MILVLLTFYVLGFITGAFVGAFSFYLTNKSDKEKLSKLPEAAKKPSLDARMRKVKDITNEQLSLLQASDGPQKNALDGKFKNNINRTVKTLEEEKVEILKSIIEDGHDPEITAQGPDGVVTKMKLSEFMVDSGITMQPKKDSKNKSINKFTVYRGGKDDGDGTSH